MPGAVEQLGACLEAVLDKQQHFLAAAAVSEARAAERRREARERAAETASELLYARNSLAEALAREQRWRADCEVPARLSCVVAALGACACWLFPFLGIFKAVVCFWLSLYLSGSGDARSMRARHLSAYGVLQ